MSQGRHRRGFYHAGGVCEQMAGYYESWRCDPKSNMSLGPLGTAQLFDFLRNEMYVTPRRGCEGNGDYPILTITPIELFRHILARFDGESWSNDNHENSETSAFVEVFGGTALAVCHADHCLDLQASMRRPSDLDARFYISSDCFDSCRAIVEDYLHLKYIQTVSSSKTLQDKLLPPSMIRYIYFQKQAVVGEAFSLLSIGDSSTGYNVDLEFALIGNDVRKYFDEGNACVIPLTLEQLAGLGPVCAVSQTGDISSMMDLHFRKELVVRNPEEVVNGLTLYVHALCDKGQSPADAQSEDFYGKAFCQAFVSKCQLLVDAGQDPLRFVLSFVRSHYALRSTLAAAAVAQMLVEMSTYSPEVWGTELGRKLSSQLALLLCDAMMATLDDESNAGEGLVSVCWLAAFLADPTARPAASEDEACGDGPRGRIRTLGWSGGYRCQVLGKRRPVDAAHVCADVARHLRRCADDAAPWQRAILAAALRVLEQGRAAMPAGQPGGSCDPEEAVAVRRGVLGVMRDAGRADLACDMLLGPAGPDLCRRMRPDDAHAAARALLECGPAEHCAALGALLVKTAAREHVHVAAREAIKGLQRRKYACPCMQRPRAPAPGHKGSATARGATACGSCRACAAVGRGIQRLLVHIVPGPARGLGPSSPASPPPVGLSSGVAPLPHSAGPKPAPPALRPASPPAPPPGPTTAAAAGGAGGLRSPSPEEPLGGRSPSPDAALPGPVSPPRSRSAGRRGSS